MIDKYKIAKAARQISEKVVDAKGFDDSKPTHLVFLDGHVDGFNAGAKWAINEFLKNLWHPANEEPKKVKNLLLETAYEYGKPIYHLIKYMPNGNNVCAWREWYKGAHISRWLYIDDLLPKEGGNQ
jgi:hypothetical protein